MSIHEALETWGLSPKEIKVYLACLELGKARVQDISQKTGIERTNNYSLLQGLIAKGLVRDIEASGKHLFIAESPENLILKLKDKEDKIKQIMPELKSLYNLSPNKPKIKFYEGKEGYSAICEETLNSGSKEILYFANLSNLYETLGGSSYDDEYYIPKRLKNNIHLRMLVTPDKRMQEMKKRDKQENRETKFLPKNFPFEGSVFIFENKTALISSSKELISLVIESKYISEMLKSMFETLWQSIK
ncbi:MAG: helix-turn-helix domain-containing protein [bacterium]